VLKYYRDAGKPVEMLMMRGESNQDAISSQRLQAIAIRPMDFVLRLRKLQIHLGTPINAVTARPARAGVADFSGRLTSPCLMVGDNGQGKSLVAKALCHAVGYDGDAQVGNSRDTGYGRLLFQDVVTQTLLRSFPELGRSGRPDADAAVTAIYRELVDLQGLSAEDVDGLGSTGPQSLLAVKTMLIAVRLARQPAALILDEPDWGLSRAAAVDLVLSVLQAAHRRGVPVILISHKPWWRPVAGSMVRVVKAVSASAETVFDIELQKAAGTAVDDGIW
jgi:predicted ATPase